MGLSRFVEKVGHFSKDETGIYFEHKNGRLNQANSVLAFADSILREVEDKKVKVTLIIEELDNSAE